MGEGEARVAKVLGLVRDAGDLVPEADGRFHYPQVESLLDLSAEKAAALLKGMEDQELIRPAGEASALGCPSCHGLSLEKRAVCPVCAGERLEVGDAALGLMRCGSCSNVFYFPGESLKCQGCGAVLPELVLSAVTAPRYALGVRGVALLNELRDQEKEGVVRRMMASVFAALVLTFAFAAYLVKTQQGLADPPLFVLYGAVILSYMATSYYIGKSSGYGSPEAAPGR